MRRLKKDISNRITLNKIAEFGIKVSNAKSVEDLLFEESTGRIMLNRIARCLVNEVVGELYMEIEEKYNNVIKSFIKLSEMSNLESADNSIKTIKELEVALKDFKDVSNTDIEIIAEPYFTSETGFNLHSEKYCDELSTILTALKEDMRYTIRVKNRITLLNGLAEDTIPCLEKIKHNLSKAYKQFKDIVSEEEKEWRLERQKIGNNNKEEYIIKKIF